MISQSYLMFLGACSATTIFFSTFNRPGIRGYRNLGFLAIYLGTAASFFLVGWKPVLIGWAIFGISSGVLYYAYEFFAIARSEEAQKEWPNPTTIIYGLLMWPVMLPEVTEYLLADLGVLKAPEMPDSDPNDTHEGEDV
jgi:hypothetical protein